MPGASVTVDEGDHTLMSSPIVELPGEQMEGRGIRCERFGAQIFVYKAGCFRM